MKNLEKSEEEKITIERATVLQRDSSEWLELRRQLLTASNFGKIIKKRDSTNASIVKALLYKRDLSHVSSIKHGVENENTALNQLSVQLNVDIQSCGLFIDPNIPYLGATPDGLIGEDKVVEVKCPISVFHSKSVKEAVQMKKLPFYKLSQDKLIVNKNHDWFFQVQGQLHITRRKYCVFGIWVGENKPLQVEIIERDTEFFETKMLPKLNAFYFEHILPELIDPRHTRNLPLRGSSIPKKRKGNPSATTSIAKKIKETDGTSETALCDSRIASDHTPTAETCIDFEDF
ncbi:hypothetical protein OBRU01_19204 [Operophtera brumata]|uniref:YqaJ viral recombinase domain-containing protein n=1 Tax=Operophtera brumata TaxID=104452 RepID=A0A0L7KXS8_OPEBR|nr:hypothetical protein OBRU01_19204 [Operophtera brumata]